MFKRVLLLVCLVAVLVVPGSASEVVVNVDCHSLDGWTGSLSNFAAGSSGIYRTDVSTSYRSISYDLPYSVPLDTDFGMTFTVHPNTDWGIGTSYLNVGLSDSSSGLCTVEFGSYTGEIGTQLFFKTAYGPAAVVRYRIERTDPEFADALIASPIRVGYYRIGTVYYCYVNGKMVHTFNSVNDTYQAPSFDSLQISSSMNYGVDRVHFSVEDISVARDVLLPDPPVESGEASLVVNAVNSVTGERLSGFSYTVAGGPSGFASLSGVCAGSEVEHSVPVVSSLSLDDYYIVGGSLDGYETPLAIMTAVPDGGALVTLRFKPLAPEPPVDAGTVLIRVLDSDTGGGVASYSFKVGPAAALGDYNGFASVTVEPGRHPWGVISANHHPAGGYVDVVANETVDLGVVYTVRRTSESPPPPTPPPELIDDIPDPETLPPFSLVDSCSWRQTIERNSLVATFASPLLDAFDTLFGVIDDMMLGIFRALLGPLVSFIGYVAGVVDLVESIVDGVVDAVSPVTTSIGLIILAIPEKVVALGTFALTLNCVLLILRGPIM